MNIPSKLAKGDSATWTDDAFVDTQGKSYDSGSYALAYRIRGPKTLDLVASASGSGWSTTITTTQSNTLDAGSYWWAAFATKTGERVTAGTGTFTISDDLAAAVAGYDGTSQAEKILATVRAAISARASGDLVTEYTIGNRSLKKESIATLLVMEAKYVRQVRREREAESIANGIGNPRRVMVRFS